MTKDIDDALAIFYKITGKKSFSQEYIDLLKEYNISETNGYLIKFKVNNEILTGQLKSRHVFSRLQMLMAKLSRSTANGSHALQYDLDMLIFLNNQLENKAVCDNCGHMALPIDNYCSKCGSKLIPAISLFELLSSINSSYIKPGDILKFNLDNTIDIASNNIKQDSLLENKQLEQLYDEKLEKQKLNRGYFKVLLLYYIAGNSWDKIDEISKNYKINSFQETLDELSNGNLIQIKNEGTFFKKLSSKFSKNNNSSNNIYSLTQKGVDFLKNNSHVILYDTYIKNSSVDDIIIFNEVCASSGPSNNIIPDYLKHMRNLSKKEDNFNKLLYTYDIESYFYETTGNPDKQLLALFKKFIVSINIGSLKLNGRDALDEASINYLIRTITLSSISIASIKEFFSRAYDGIGCGLIFSKEESFTYFLRCINGANIKSLNLDIEHMINKKRNA